MGNIDFYKVLLALLSTFITFIFGEFDKALQILCALVILDYITGVTVSWLNGTIDSAIGFKGIAKKIFIFIVISLGHFADLILNNGDIVRISCTYFYIANECISIIENGGSLGVPIPQCIKDALTALHDKSDKNE